METQSQEEKSNVVVLRPKNEGRFAHTVTQEDLLELKQYSNEINEARQRYQEKKEYIKAALRGGARVEDGVFSAELVAQKGGGCFVEVYEYEKLVVR
jgi:hypothetical protein